ncbi:unnamed protein product, partial [Vitis vinifera]
MIQSFSRNYSSSYVHSNIAGLVNLLEVCKSANPQPAIVWASSSSVRNRFPSLRHQIPTTDLQTGLKKFVRWYLKYYSAGEKSAWIFSKRDFRDSPELQALKVTTTTNQYFQETVRFHTYICKNNKESSRWKRGSGGTPLWPSSHFGPSFSRA